MGFGTPSIPVEQTESEDKEECSGDSEVFEASDVSYDYTDYYSGND